MKSFLTAVVVCVALHTAAQNGLRVFKLMQDTVYMTDTLTAGESYRLEWDLIDPTWSHRVTALGCSLMAITSDQNQKAFLCTPHIEATEVILVTRRSKANTEVKDPVYVFPVVKRVEN